MRCTYWRVAASVRAATNSTIRKASNHETIRLLSHSERSQGEFDYCAPGKSRNQKSQCRLLTTFQNSLNLGQSARNKDSKQSLNTTQYCSEFIPPLTGKEVLSGQSIYRLH